ETESEFIRAEIERLMTPRPCPVCKGKRLKPEYLAVSVADRSIMDVCDLSITAAQGWFTKLQLTERETLIARAILKEIRERLQFLVDVGLDYLSLARAADSLSGGEAQRIRLATQIGSKLMGVLYILDEPSIGLHQRDNRKLINTLLALRDIGNTVVVIEHDEETMRTADFIVDIGPGAGEHGGRIVATGSFDDILKSPEPITGAFLRGDRSIPLPPRRRPPARRGPVRPPTPAALPASGSCAPGCRRGGCAATSRAGSASTSRAAAARTARATASSRSRGTSCRTSMSPVRSAKVSA